LDLVLHNYIETKTEFCLGSSTVPPIKCDQLYQLHASNTQKLKLQLKIKKFSKFHIETFSRSKIYMPNATPTPTPIVIQKIGAVSIPNPNFFGN
jgi:hypothetical protein